MADQSPALRIEPAAPGDTDGLRHLFETVFGHAVSAEHWHWKYTGPPGATALHRVARLQPVQPLQPQTAAAPPPLPGGLLGHVGALVLPAVFDGKPAWVAHLTDVMVHPQARSGLEGSSVYARLMRAIAADLTSLQASLHPASGPLLAHGFPGRTPASLGQRMGLYRSLQPVQVHHFRADPAASSAVKVDLITDFSGPLPADVQREIDRVWRRCAAQQPQPLVHKGAPYLGWRYGRHPQRPYRLWRVRAGWWRRTVGWLVTRQHPQALVADALLPAAWSTGAAWVQVLQALSVASGQPQWSTWRPLPPQAPHSSETSLIVPVEFRAAELAGQGATPWARRPQPAWPLFQPGDTDVF